MDAQQSSASIAEITSTRNVELMNHDVAANGTAA